MNNFYLAGICLLFYTFSYSQLSIDYSGASPNIITTALELESGGTAVAGKISSGVPWDPVRIGIIQSNLGTMMFDTNDIILLVDEFSDSSLLFYKYSIKSGKGLYVLDEQFSNPILFDPLEEFKDISYIKGKQIGNNYYVVGAGLHNTEGNSSFIYEFDSQGNKLNFNLITSASFGGLGVGSQLNNNGFAFTSDNHIIQISSFSNKGPSLSKHSLDGTEVWQRTLVERYHFYDIAINSNDEIYLAGKLELATANKTDLLAIVAKYNQSGIWLKQATFQKDPSLSPEFEADLNFHKILISESDEVFAFGMDKTSTISYIPITFGHYDSNLNEINTNFFSLQPTTSPKVTSYTRAIFYNNDSVVTYNTAEQFEGLPVGFSATISGFDLTQQELISSNSLLLYPNPTSDFLTLKDAKYNSITESRVSILSQTGQRISVEQISDHISVGDLNPGLYYLLIETDNKRQLLKFAKQ